MYKMIKRTTQKANRGKKKRKYDSSDDFSVSSDSSAEVHYQRTKHSKHSKKKNIVILSLLLVTLP